ncbi:hypothetical protein HJG53_00110 [Sphingomonas sp. ID1715]|uniref:hypothetical protein n=1 Tax=Sphingomonas sp. ID1715 TaxID=1656898 RepID=UPI001488BD60|nr:hypothetical protein [Sphingomonas sp. ID1715]NNM75315.1 hypothetical protein [Sphingomonas sp. ID1715]
MNTIRTLAVATTALLSIPAFGQTAAPAPAATPSAAATPAAAGAPQITAGAQVSGPDGGAVGTIASTGADFAVVKTDKHEVRLPRTAFAAGPNGLVIGLSRDQLNAQVEQAKAQTADALKAGAVVNGSGGAQAATVEKVEGEFVTVKLKSGKMVRLPKAAIAAGPNGLVIGMTADQLEAQAAAAGG